MNTLYFFTPQNYHIAIIHLHVLFKRIESSEKLGGTTNLVKNNAKKGGEKNTSGCVNQRKHSLLRNGCFCFPHSTRKQLS